MANAKADEVSIKKEIAVDEKLLALTRLQLIDSKIDKLRNVRGELPLEVEDLKDELLGLETRIENLITEVADLEKQIEDKKNTIVNCRESTKKYEEQRNNVRNNREYDSLTKEIEYQELEIELSEKRIKEYTYKLEIKKEAIDQSKVKFDERQEDLVSKKSELKELVTETETDEKTLTAKSIENQNLIESRLLNAYQRIRKNARNGLAVVAIERDACGGCFNNIPPQRQLDIRMHQKIIVCEYCGRILVDQSILDLANENL